MKYWGLPPLIFACLILFPSNALSWQGRVLYVSEGDILCISRNHKEIDVRLYGVDTPEKGQPYGCKSKRFTERLAGNERVEVVSKGRDQYGRVVALVYIEGDGECLNEELARSGHAWVHEPCCRIRDCDHWQRLESQARKSGKGLWDREHAVPPWDWRHSDQDSSNSEWRGSSGKDKSYIDFETKAKAKKAYEAHELLDSYWLDGNNEWEASTIFPW